MLQAVADILKRRQVQGWLVGGSVRDRELGRSSPDLDVVVSDDAAAFAREVARSLGAPWFTLSERHPAYRVMGREGHIDVAAVKGRGILDDLAERDFTINAMAASVGSDRAGREGIVDPYGGLAHLRERRLVAVAERIFTDDPLRLMRAARFCHVLGLQLDPALAAAVRTQASELRAAAAERVAAEMVLTLIEGRAADAVRLWADLGLLAVVLPALASPESLVPTITLLERLDDLLERPGAWFGAAEERLAARLAEPVDGSVTRPVALRLAGLVHRLAPREAAAIGWRLKLSGDMISLLRTGAGCSAEGRSLPAAPRGRDAVLFLWEAHPWEPEVIVLEAAAAATEAAVSEGSGRTDQERVLEPARQMMAFWADRERGVPRLPVDGEMLMRELGIESGPLLGKVLLEARLAWEAGEATTRAEVLAVAREALGQG